ncbi:DUF3987 domain-containing protein [Salinibacter ruber]|uniref:DUF3987 domain-containing protein n=1 Tax=Salinibacter ruber TaxID=146919 RepID=UPI00160768C1|nr:DUF3987 domain-containing protein [Salinibacter ruber]MBB4089914.1 hypothetical protein [Salinibacter ruber]
MSNDRPELNAATDGESTTGNLGETIRHLEEDLEEEREKRWSYQYKLKQIEKELQKHGLSADDVVDGRTDPSKLQKLQVESCNRTRLEWRDFPLGVLPDAVQKHSKAQAEAMCVDPSMIAVPSLVVLSAAIGNSRHIRVKSNWTEPATLWEMIIQASGALKSPAQEKALAPVFRKEKALKKKWERKLARWEEKDSDERSQRPTRERRLVNDATVESVALLHSDHPRGLLLYRDELAGWLGSFNQYNKGDSDLQKWMEFYGSRPVQVDRKSSDRPAIFIEHPSVSVIGTIQPEVLEDRLDALHFQSGFVARTLLCEPPERPRRFNDHSVTKEAKEEYHNLVGRLYSLVMPDRDEMTIDKDLSLNGEAREVYSEFFDECERLKEKLRSGPLRALVSKNQAIGARLSLILQLCEDPDSSEIGRDAAIGGTTLARWFRHEAARIYQRHGFNERGVSKERRRAKKLPSGTFGVETIQEVWDCAQRTAYNVRDRLMEEGLLEKEGHGKYRSLIAEGETDPFEHFAP